MAKPIVSPRLEGHGPDFERWAQLSILKIYEVAALMNFFDPHEVGDYSDRNGGAPDFSHDERSLISAARAGKVVAYLEPDQQPRNDTELSVESLAPWLRARGYVEFADAIDSLNGVAVVSQAPKIPPSSHSPAESNGWKMRIQIEATSLMKTLQISGASPTVASILDDMVSWCRKNNVRTDSGIIPAANYLRTHVLDAKHWSPPK